MSPIIKQRLSRFRNIFFREKYRFDQGNAFLVFLNFTLLVISLVRQSHGDKNMILYYIILGFIGTWILGYFLDKVVRVQDAQEKIAFKRSPIWQENFNYHHNHKSKINEVNKKLEKIEKIVKEIKSEN
jgi:hypothetical protein